MWSLFKTPNNASFYTIVKWFAWPGLQVCFGAQTSHLLILQHHTSYFMALFHRIEAVDLQDHHMFKNLNPKHPINLFLIGYVKDQFRLCLCLCLCVNAVCSNFVLLITYFRAVYVGHGALWHSPGIKKGVTSSLLLNVTFVKGIMGHFIQCWWWAETKVWD